MTEDQLEDDGRLVKKVAGYHQYHAVRAAIGHVVAASRPDGAANRRGQGGVVWRTQGSRGEQLGLSR